MRRSALLLFALLAGCSAVNPPSDHIAEPLEADGFCAGYANLICDAIMGCCSIGAMYERSECMARYGRVCTNLIGPLISDPRTGYDAAEAGVQLNIGRQMAERCDPLFNHWLSRRDGLTAMFSGTAEDAQACEPTFMENFTIGGRVDTPRFYSCASAGSACRATVGLSEWQCLGVGAVGDPCILPIDCLDGLTCRAVSDTRAECLGRQPDGDICGQGSQCESYDCQCEMVGDEVVCRCVPDDTIDQVYCGLLY